MLKIPETTILRLSLYLREARRLEDMKTDFVSSRRISKELGFSDAQIRRDLNYFGQFGRSGKGYDVSRLKKVISGILGVSKRKWSVALVGVGNLGSALLSYKGFKEQGFMIKAAFDKLPDRINKTIAGLRILSAEKIVETLKRERIKIGIIAVPSDDAQKVADMLIRGGVKGILNFAPAKIQVPQENKIIVRNVDLSTELEVLSYFLSQRASQKSFSP